MTPDRMVSLMEDRADLLLDPSTPSGYRWTSSTGPPIKLRTGTECVSSVILESVPPITLVMPMLKNIYWGSARKPKDAV